MVGDTITNNDAQDRKTIKLSISNQIKTIDELQGKTFLTCSACMSVWADGLSWANAHPEKIAKTAEEADNIAVLSCQVTDLAILNDLRTLERLYRDNPKKNCFISGCLAKRADVGIPEFAGRLETPRESYQFLFYRSLVHFEKPFWVKEFIEQDDETRDGHLFRNKYPLRIGKGCPNKCTYCTIRLTRGDFEQYDASRLEQEFLVFDDVLLIADSPTAKQIKDWAAIAQKHKKAFSIRNVEPSVTVRVEPELMGLADRGLLEVYHSPIQSVNPKVLRDMHRDVSATLKTMEIARELKKRGVYVTTNIIVDYKGISQDFRPIYETYDYVGWNPLWDRTKAEERFEKYIVREDVPEITRCFKLLKGGKE